jgi:hypothetical protein
MTHNPIRRILAVDIRSQKFGYAVLETPHRLLDWGVRTSGVRHRTWYIADLLHMYQPSAVVLRRITAGGKRDSPGARNIMRAIKSEACRFEAPIAFLGTSALNNFFRQYGMHTKYEIASLLAASFSELKWKLPPSRRKKSWKSEPRRMSVFDALQLGVVFLALHVGEDAIRALLVNG